MPAAGSLLIIYAEMPPAGARLFAGAEQRTAETEDALLAAFLADTARTSGSLPGRARIAVTISRSSASVTAAGRPPFFEAGNFWGRGPVSLLEQGLEDGYDAVCVIGTRTPHLPAAFLLEAFGRLRQHPDVLVLGPTDDSRLYLIGAARRVPKALGSSEPWETPGIAKTLVERAAASELSVTLLPSWYDVGSLQGLDRLQRDLHRGVIDAPETANLLRKWKQDGI